MCNANIYLPGHKDMNAMDVDGEGEGEGEQEEEEEEEETITAADILGSSF